MPEIFLKWQLLKNPGSLENIGASSRGVILPNGDLYIENRSDGTIHNDILKLLFQNGILKGKFRRNWTHQTPNLSGFLTVQRYLHHPVICIGESNNALYTRRGYEATLHFYLPFLEKARLANPGIRFSNKLVKIRTPFKGDVGFVTFRPGD